MAMLDWGPLEQACMSCQKCALADTRHNVVFGAGVPNAEVMFIGEGPGENEDLQGEPFVGRGGKLLDDMLELIDLDRKKNVYIANIVKCRPPHNRDLRVPAAHAEHHVMPSIRQGAPLTAHAGLLQSVPVHPSHFPGPFLSCFCSSIPHRGRGEKPR